MVATTQTALVTAEQFMEMDLGDGNFELVRGEVIRVSPGNCEHGSVCAMISFILIGYGKQSGYGRVMSNDSPVRTERNPDTVRGADVIFYSHARLQKSMTVKDFGGLHRADVTRQSGHDPRCMRKEVDHGRRARDSSFAGAPYRLLAHH